MQHRRQSASRRAPDAPQPDARLLRRSRAALRASTALQAAALLVLGLPARAQPAPNARPASGRVSSGSASIGGNATTTLIRQSSQNAVINWQSYDVGAAQTVQYAQPGAASFTLNRVVSANPSQIAGHILANGRIAIVNQSGVVFLQGSTVDTAGLVVSAAGITDQDFMAGRLVFVQPPQPGAVVSNAGRITVRQAGLAALVAPQVANSGTITAVLGRVVLGGATTHTLDLYGDGLVALNVTGQVTQVQLGGHTVTALVTNTGTILAPGGTVVLTAQAADGVVSKLISAGGTIAAPSVGGQTGRVLVSGVGGDIEIDGAVQATGAAGAGGSVTVTGNHNVTVAPGGVLDASGAAGGGAVSLLAPSGNAVVASGAVLRARGTAHGRGGRITVQAGGTAGVHGTLDASGATSSDLGGTLTVGGNTLSVDGWLSASLPGEAPGEAIYKTSGSLTVASSCAGVMGKCLPFMAFENDLSTIVDKNGSITFEGALGQDSAPIVLTTTGTKNATGNIVFSAGTTLSAASFDVQAAGSIVADGVLTSAGLISLSATHAISVGGVLSSAAGTVSLSAGTPMVTGDISEHDQSGTGAVDAMVLIVSAQGSAVLDGASNSIATLGSVTTGGSFTLTDAAGLSVTAPVMAGGDVTISVTGTVGGIPNGLTTSDAITGQNIALSAAGSLALGGSVNAGAYGLALAAGSGDITASAGVTAGTLAASAGGAVTLDAAGTSIGTIGAAGTLTGILAGGAVTIGSGAGTLEIAQSVTGTSVMLSAGGLTLDSGVTVQATTGDIGLTAGAGTLSLAGTILTGTAARTGIDAALTTLSATGGDLAETQGASIQTGTLTASATPVAGAGGAVALGSTANIVGTLAGGTAAGGLDVGDSTALTIAANASVSGSNITFATGSLVLLGGATIDAAAGFTAQGDVAQGVGALIHAGTLATIAGGLAQTQATLSAGTLALGTGGQAGSLTQDASSILLGGGGGTIVVSGSLSQDSMSRIVAQGGTLSLSSGGSQVLAGLVKNVSGTVDLLATGGGITQTDAGATGPTGTLIAGTLALQAGTTGGAAFDARLDDGAANRIGTLSAANITGALILDQGTTLTLAGQALGTVGGTFTLGAGLHALAGATMVLGGLTVGGDLTEETGADLAVDGLASIAGSLIQTGGTLSAGTIALGTGLAVRNTAVALTQSAGASLDSGGALTVNGAITQDASALSATGSLVAYSLTQTSSSVSLGTGVGGGLTVTGDLAQDAASSVTVSAGTLALTSVAGNLFLAGLVSDSSGLVSLDTPAGTITQTARGGTGVTGTLIAGTFSAQAGTAGGAPFAILLGGAPTDANRVGTITQAVATGAVDIADGSAQPTLAVASGGSVASGAGFGVTLDAGLLLLLANAGITSGADFTATGAVTEDAGARIGATGGATTGGALTQTGATLTATGDVTIGTLTPGGTMATLLSQNASSLLHADGTVDVLGSATQTASTLSAGGAATIADSVAQSASSLSGTSVAIGSVALSGTLSQSAGSTIQATSADVVAMLAGALTQDGTSAILATDGRVTLASTGGGLSLGGRVVANLATGTLSLTAGGGAITESATGSLLGGTLVASATGGIDLSTVSGPGIGNDLAVLGRVSAAGTVALADGVGATLAGTLSGSGVSLRMPTLSVLGGGAIDISSGGTVAIGADSISLAGQVSAPGGLVAIGLLHPGTFSVMPGGTIDAASLRQIVTGDSGTIALGTTDGVMANGTGGANATWNATTTGSVGTLSVLSALDLSASTGTLGLFSNGAILVNTAAPANGLVVGALYGAAAGDFLAPSSQNGIADIGVAGLTAQGGTLVLATGGTLTLLAAAQASGTAGVTLSALGGTLTQDSGSAIASTAGGIVLNTALLVQDTQASVAGQTGVTIGGTVVQSGADTISAATGDYQSGGVTQSAASTITALQGSASIAGSLVQHASGIAAGTLASVADSVAQDAGSRIEAGTITLATSGTGTLSQAGGASITATAGILSATLSGDLTQSADSALTAEAGDVSLSSSGGALLLGGLVSGQNGQVSLVAGQTVTQTLPGGSPSGTLLAGTLVAQAGTSAPATDLLLTGGHNAVNIVALATASGQVSLDDTTSLTEAASGSIAGNGVTLTLAGQAFTQGAGAAITSGGTVAIDAPALTQTDLAAITAQAGFYLSGNLVQQSRGSIQATMLDLHVAGSATQFAGSTLSAISGSLLVDGAFLQTASQASAGLDVVVGQGASQSGGTILAGDLATIAGGLAQAGGSSITAGDVSIGTAGSTAGVSQATSSITATSGSVVLTLSDGLAQDASSGITSQVGSLVIYSTGGTLAAGGTLSAVAGLVDLVAQAGDITQIAPGGTVSSGVIQSASLGVQAGVPGAAGADAVLLGGSNSIGTLVGAAGGMLSGAAGQVVLADQAPLTLAAGTTLSAGGDISVTLAVPATLTQGASSVITAAGAIGVQAATLSQQAGAILTGGTSVTLTGNLQQIAQGEVTATQGSLLITGSITQTDSAITAALGSLTIAGDATQSSGAIDALHGDVTIGGALGQTASSLRAGGAVAIGPGPGGTAVDVLSQLAGSSADAGGGITVYGAATQDASSLSAVGAAVIYGSLNQSGATLSGSAVTIGQNGLAGTLSQLASTVVAGAGDLTVTLSGNLGQDARSSLASSDGRIRLTTTGGQLALGGLISVAPQSTVSLVAPAGDITQTAPGAASPTGTLLAGTLTAQAGGAGGTVAQLTLDGTGVNQVGTLTQASATGSLLLVDAETLTEASSGGVSGTAGVTLRAPGVVQLAGGGITASQGRVDLQTALLTQAAGASVAAQTGFALDGSLVQAGANLVATATGDAVIGGNLDQAAGSVVRAVLGSASVGGTLGQVDSTLSAGAAVGIGGSAVQTGGILAAGGALAVGGTLQQADSQASAASVMVGGDLAQSGSTLTVANGAVFDGLLSQTASLLQAGGAVSVAGAARQSAGAMLLTGGALSIGGALQQSGSMVHAASVRVGAVSQSVSGLSADGDLTIDGSLAQMQSGIDAGGGVSVAGSVNQAEGPGGSMSQGSTLSAGGNLSVAGAISQVSGTIKAGGTVSQTGGFLTQAGASSLSGSAGVLLTLSGDLNQDLGSSIASVAGDISIASSGGELNFSGQLASSPRGQVGLLAGFGGISSSGAVQAGTLSARAFAGIDLSGAANRIASVGPVSIAGGLSQSGVTSVSSGVFLSDSTALLVRDAAISGVSTVRLTLASDLTESVTGTLSSDVGPLTVSSPGTLSFAGLIAGPQIVLGNFPAPGAARRPPGTVEPAMIAWSGGTVMTGTALPAGPGEPDIPAPISPASSQGARGLFAMAANFSQTGTTRILGLGQKAETVEFSLIGPGGLIAFDPGTSAGLVAPGAQLLLDLQATGRATGNVDVAGLNIFIGQPATGGASLTGLVDGRGGSAAAASGFVHGLANVRYEDNGCPVQSLNCVLLSPVVVPLGSPVQNLVVAVAHDTDEDDDLILPNVAEQDY